MMILLLLFKRWISKEAQRREIEGGKDGTNESFNLMSDVSNSYQ
jgi:hypothetical protein